MEMDEITKIQVLKWLDDLRAYGELVGTWDEADFWAIDNVEKFIEKLTARIVELEKRVDEYKSMVATR